MQEAYTVPELNMDAVRNQLALLPRTNGRLTVAMQTDAQNYDSEGQYGDAAYENEETEFQQADAHEYGGQYKPTEGTDPKKLIHYFPASSSGSDSDDGICESKGCLATVFALLVVVVVSVAGLTVYCLRSKDDKKNAAPTVVVVEKPAAAGCTGDAGKTEHATAESEEPEEKDNEKECERVRDQANAARREQWQQDRNRRARWGAKGKALTAAATAGSFCCALTAAGTALHCQSARPDSRLSYQERERLEKTHDNTAKVSLGATILFSFLFLFFIYLCMREWGMFCFPGEVAEEFDSDLDL